MPLNRATALPDGVVNQVQEGLDQAIGILGIHRLGHLGEPDEIGEEDHHVATFDHGVGAGLIGESCQQPTAMPERGHPHLLEVGVGQVRGQRQVDVVLQKTLGILAEAKIKKNLFNTHICWS